MDMAHPGVNVVSLAPFFSQVSGDRLIQPGAVDLVTVMCDHQVLAELEPYEFVEVIEYANPFVVLEVHLNSSVQEQRGVWIMIAPGVDDPHILMFLQHPQDDALDQVSACSDGPAPSPITVQEMLAVGGSAG